MKSAETYRRRARDVAAFADAVDRLVAAAQRGDEAEAHRVRAEIDLLSGPAAYGFDAAGSVVNWKPRGTFQQVQLNPAAEWATILDYDPRFDPDTLLACARQAIGVLNMQAEEADEYERHHVRHRVQGLARLTGRGLRPLARWALGAAGAVVVAGVIYWLGWI